MSNGIKEVYSLSSNIMLIDNKGQFIVSILYDSNYVYRPYIVYVRTGQCLYYKKEEYVEYIQSCKLYKVEEISDNKVEFLDSNIVEKINNE